MRGISRARGRIVPNVHSPWVRAGHHRRPQRGRLLRLSQPYIHRTVLNYKKQMKWTFGGLTDRQLKKTFRRSNVVKRQSELFLTVLERRLDSTVMRAGFARSMPEARRLVSNGWIEVNGAATRSPRFHVKNGDVVSISHLVWSAMYHRMVKRVRTGAFTNPAPWLLVDYQMLLITVIDTPIPSMMSYTHPIDMGFREGLFTAAPRQGHRNIQ